MAVTRRDLQPPCDILCGHIRQKTQENKHKEDQERLTEEIKTFLKLLCGEEKSPSRECKVDLSSSFLQGANLSNAHLKEANLSGAQLNDAILSGAQLQGANLSNAHLKEANLSDAQLQGTDLKGAQLHGAHLQQAQLQGANLPDAQLQEANLSDAKLQGADLSKAQLQGANLTDAQLHGIGSSGEFPEMSFQDRIRVRVGKESDFINVVFSGGLDAGQIKEIIASMPAGMGGEEKEEMKNKLNGHVGKEASNVLPDNSGGITGIYNKDEAEEWIAKYEESTNRQPTKDE